MPGGNLPGTGGFPVAVGAKWVLIAETGDGGFFDGQTAVRLRGIVRVKRDSSFEGRFATTQPEWPPTAPAGIDLNSTSGLIKSMSGVSPLIGVEQEERHHSRMRWIGVLDEISKGWLWLHQVRSREKPVRASRGGRSAAGTA